jgi:hypothetical protein
MKIRIFLFSVLLIGTLASFTASAPTGGVQVKIELPEGIKIDLADAPIGISKSKEALQNADYINTVWTNAAGMADFGQMPAGTYYIDGYTDDDITQNAYYGEMQIEVVAGKNGVHVLKLEVSEVVNLEDIDLEEIEAGEEE